MTKFNGTIEYISGQRAAIIELVNINGEWSGGGRIDLKSGSKADLYEEGYRQLSINAAGKGGTLETYRVLS
jgi:hypothetical protein